MDVLEFLEKEKKNPFRNLFLLSGKSRKALGLLLGFLKRKLTLKEFYWSLRPVSIRPIEITIKRQNYINQELSQYLIYNKVLNEDNSLNLFNKKFYFLNLEDVLGSISQLILNDEHNVKEFIKDDFVVFDIGANIGVWTVFVANILKKGKVYAFEPVSLNFSILEKNTKDYQNVKIFKYGLGDVEKEEEILIRSWASGDSTISDSNIKRPIESFDIKEKIKILTLDSFIEKEKIKRVNFIKIDTEGYEVNVLKGSVKTIKKYKPILSVSCHSKENIDFVIKFIPQLDHNYKFFVSSKDKNDIFFIYQKN